jgi:chromosome segregation ATPase
MSETEVVRGAARTKTEIESLKAEMQEIKKTCKAILQAMKDLEESMEEEFMPAGEFMGVTFEP